MTNEKNNDIDRDLELDALLAPLRGLTPSPDMLRNWETIAIGGSVPIKIPIQSYARKIMEWSIAAAIGFTAATIVFRNSNSPVEDNSTNFTDVDATEMRFVAK